MSTCNIVLVGPPGSGKGTQAARIGERYGIPIIATGDALRAASTEGTALGRQLKDVMASGGLVSDDLMIDLMRERLARGDAATGFVLDGFPRTLVQARALDQMLDADGVLAIVLSVPDAELERRLSSRRICMKCKTLYTAGTPYGSEEEHCARCRVALIRRDDDNPDTIRRRLVTYRAMADQLIGHYRTRPTFAMINGSAAADEVSSSIASHIDRALAARAQEPRTLAST